MKKTKATATVISIEIHAKTKEGRIVHFKASTKEGNVKEWVDFLAALYDGVGQSPDNPEFEITSTEYSQNLN